MCRELANYHSLWQTLGNLNAFYNYLSHTQKTKISILSMLCKEMKVDHPKLSLSRVYINTFTKHYKRKSYINFGQYAGVDPELSDAKMIIRY